VERFRVALAFAGPALKGRFIALVAVIRRNEDYGRSGTLPTAGPCSRSVFM
jgi:hypothetical protein